MCLGRPLISIKGKFRPNSGIGAPIDRGVLAPLAVAIAVSLVIVNSVYKRIFI